jgi:hypothetical protein
MSAILAAETGEDLVCIQTFAAWPKGKEADPNTSRIFRIGQRVRYVGFYQDPKVKNSPVGWMVLFEPKNMKHPQTFLADQTRFVTGAGWELLRRYFARKQAARPRPRIAADGHDGHATKTNGHKKHPPRPPKKA